MEGGSILSMIAGFLPPTAADPPPSQAPNAGPPPPAAAASRKASPAAGRQKKTCTYADAGAYFDAVEPRQRDVHMICFSKDRAFQLDQLLESAERHLRLGERGGRVEEGDSSSAPPSIQLHVSVLYLVSDPTAGGGAAGDDATAPSLPSSRCEAGALEDARAEKAREASPSPSPTHGARSRTMDESYSLVQRRHPSVKFLRERPGEFCDQLCSLLGEDWGLAAKGREEGEDGGEERGAAFVLFAVDDMFFYRDFDLPGALSVLARDPSTFCIHPRLHPGITWSHTSGVPCNVPPLSPTGRRIVPSQRVIDHGGSAGSSSSTQSIGCRSQGDGTSDGSGRRKTGERRAAKDETPAAGDGDGPLRQATTTSPVTVADFGLLTFARREGTGEWDYPWDLTGGLYRRQDAIAVVNGIISAFGKAGAGNPNLLEYHGHALLRQQDLPQCKETESPSSTTTTIATTSDVSSKPQASAETKAFPSSCLATVGRSSAETVTVAPSAIAGEVNSPVLTEGTAVSSVGAPASTATAAAISAAVEAVNTAPRCGCSGIAVVSSIAVNRVQSTYSTPVYASGDGGVQDLDRRLWASSAAYEGALGSAVSRKDAARAATPIAARPAVPEGPAAEQMEGPGERRCVRRDGVNEGGEPKAHAPAATRGRGGRRGGLDGAMYRRRVFNSVHVGELWFDGGDVDKNTRGVELSRSGEDSRGSPAGSSGGEVIVSGRVGTDDNNNNNNNNNSSNNNTDNTAVTVLLPVKDGGDLLLDAIESVVACAREMPPGSPVELLIVDDGSKDGAVERAVAAITGGCNDSEAVTVSAPGCGGGGVPGDALGGGGGDGGETRRKRGGKVARKGKIADEGGARVDDDSNRVGDSGTTSGSWASVASGLAVRGACTPCGITVRVLRHDRPLGLAESLNEGLREARSELVARMDADDFSVPGRLRRQVSFMLDNPHVAVLGTSVATFSGRSVRVSCDRDRATGQHQQQRPEHQQQTEPPRQKQGGDKKKEKQEQEQEQESHYMEEPEAMASVLLPASGVQRVASHPIDPAFLAWSMLFGCCVAHPSVMLRRDRVVRAGGYDSATEPAEDYDLWLRMEALESGSVANLGEVLLGLRKHDANVSNTRRQEQSEAADAAAARAMSRLLDNREGCRERGQGAEKPPSADVTAAVRRPESAASASDLVEAARLLGDLGEAAVAVSRRGHGGGVHMGDLRSEVTNRSPEDRVSDRHDGSDGRSRDEQRRRGEEMVARDVEARLGAMAVLAMSRFGSGAAPVFEEYRRRFPDRPLLFALGGGGGR